MAKVTPLSGFPELLPAERYVERSIVDRLSRTFELHGFANIETRVAEPLDRLAKGGEIDKEIYVLRRLHAAEEEDDTGLGMHYDLTVPFARYVLENAGRLEFPFRRYQIQKAWRGERPQEGRFREFTQADLDVVDRDELSFHHEVEVTSVMAEALVATPLPPMSMHLSNRKLIEGFYRGLGLPDPAPVMRVVDKLDKMPADAVEQMLVEDVGLGRTAARQCLRLASIRSADGSFVDEVRRLGIQHPLLDTGLAELAAVLDGCTASSGERFTVEADLRIARGLDYYTGTVVEIFMTGYEFLKSVGGGGRYDALATDGSTTYPGVGISFGVSRSVVPLLSRGTLAGSRPVPSAVLVAVADENSRAASAVLADRLRARGIPCELPARAQKYGRQIRYAERRGIPFVWFPAVGDDSHEVKDIRSGQQVAADPDGWRPPADDLLPRVVVDGEGG